MTLLLLASLFSVRPVDPIAAATLDFAAQRSAIVRSLIDSLRASNVIVHVESSRTLPDGIGGTTRFIVSRGSVRYLRITIEADLPIEARVGLLAHELRHACEMSDSGARDTGELRSLFERVGMRRGNYFETAAAIEIERRVRAELRERRTLQAEPVVKFHH